MLINATGAYLSKQYGEVSRRIADDDARGVRDEFDQGTSEALSLLIDTVCESGDEECVEVALGTLANAAAEIATAGDDQDSCQFNRGRMPCVPSLDFHGTELT